MENCSFDKMKCIANIYSLAKQQGIKIGDLETEAGVSAGYLSRLNKKDNNATPSIEFLFAIAKRLNVSLDLLINGNFEGLTSTEKYLLKFLNRLTTNTNDDDLDWDKESVYDLKGIYVEENGIVHHPLFTIKEEINSASDSLFDSRNLVYYSKFIEDEEVYVAGNCYKCQLTDSKNLLYIMRLNIRNSEVAFGDDFFEVYIVSNETVNSICCTHQTREEISKQVEILYESVEIASANLKINSEARDIIDLYMLDDDLPDLPFI